MERRARLLKDQIRPRCSGQPCDVSLLQPLLSFSNLPFLPSSLSARPVAHWHDISDDILTLQNPDGVFDDTDPRIRNEVELHLEPLLDEDGIEKHIFAADGSRIHRRVPRFASGGPSCGIIINLNKMRDLFYNRENMFRGAEEDNGNSKPPQYYLYPQSFLRDHGHFQAHGVPPALAERVDVINAAVAAPIMIPNPFHNPENSNDHHEPELRPSGAFAKAVEPLSIQAYNGLLHAVRPTAGDHDAQNPRITHALAGLYASTPKEKLIAKRKAEDCDKDLPHERYRKRIDNARLPCDLRLEYITQIKMKNLPSNRRTGRYVLPSPLSFLS